MILFYVPRNNGWTGINIDACPGSMKLFEKLRPRDINLEIGISDKASEQTYYIIDNNSPMNSFSRTCLTQIGMLNHVKQEISVSTYPLSEVLDKHLPNRQKIDFINIDTEGMDHVILISNNWPKYRPSVISVELEGRSVHDLLNNQSAKYLFDLGYEICGKTVILNNMSTVIFIDKEFRI